MLNNIDVHVGHRLRIRRRLLSMTQVELGERIGVKFQQIHKYETGKNRISASRLWETAAALNVKVGYFFEGLDFTPSQSEQRSIETDITKYRDTNDLMRVISRMDRNQRNLLQHLFETLNS